MTYANTFLVDIHSLTAHCTKQTMKQKMKTRTGQVVLHSLQYAHKIRSNAVHSRFTQLILQLHITTAEVNHHIGHRNICIRNVDTCKQ